MKRNKKGFTLVEILGVIVLLSFVFLISYTTILSVLKSSQLQIDDNVFALLKSATKDYMSDNQKDFPEDNGNVLCVDIQILVDNNYIEKDVIENQDDSLIEQKMKITYKDNDSEYEIVNKCETKIQMYDEYVVSAEVYVHDEAYYVISDSNEQQNYVTLLKALPLTVDEVNTYGADHINRYTYSAGIANNQNGYGGIAYYSGENCHSNLSSGCKNATTYNSSEVKYAVDAWARAKFTNGELATDNNGYEARLITISELENLGYVKSGSYYPKTDDVPKWLYNSIYRYWTMSAWNNSSISVWSVDNVGNVADSYISLEGFVVRPVINVYKSAIQ